MSQIPFAAAGGFDIEALGDEYGGYQARQVFMKLVDPKRFHDPIFVDSDTVATLRGSASELCVALFWFAIAFDQAPETLGPGEDPGFAPSGRFSKQPELGAEPLAAWGALTIRIAWRRVAEIKSTRSFTARQTEARPSSTARRMAA
jgi:hypothetical protein